MIRKFLINGFIIYHLLAIISWSFPDISPARNNFNVLFRSYMMWLGTWQGWEMFAPNPTAYSMIFKAQAIYQDGSQLTWGAPTYYVWKKNPTEKASTTNLERYRKWGVERITQDAQSYLWPTAVRYIKKRIMAEHPEKGEPRQIKLLRVWQDIPPPSPATLKDGLFKSEADYKNSYLFFVR